jgi:GNAT superfamily N-acetyltransferase
MIIRHWKREDDVIAMTQMLHRAYSALAARGLRYTATHQTPDVTLRRLAKGRALVAEIDGRIVGTVTSYGPDPESDTPFYRDPGTVSFGQFGVDPEFRSQGIGRALHAAMLAAAVARGAKYVALDTAAPAFDLIALYERWGYAVVGRAQWKTTNYESVIMRRPAGPMPNQHLSTTEQAKSGDGEASSQR